MEHVGDFAEWIGVGDLLFDERSSDMNFIVEGERVPAHRIIFAASCEYFRDLLEENMEESLWNEVVLESIPLKGFKLLMSYIYTEQLRLEELDENTILEVLDISRRWGFEELETVLCQHLKRSLSIENVPPTSTKAHLHVPPDTAGQLQRITETSKSMARAGADESGDRQTCGALRVDPAATPPLSPEAIRAMRDDRFGCWKELVEYLAERGDEELPPDLVERLEQLPYIYAEEASTFRYAQDEEDVEFGKFAKELQRIVDKHAWASRAPARDP